jgi:PAS domain S-box-containing protein
MLWGVTSYFLSRRGHYRISLQTGTYVGSIAIVATNLALFEEPSLVILNFLLLLMIFSTFFLSSRVTLPLVIFQSAAILGMWLGDPSLEVHHMRELSSFLGWLWLAFVFASLFGRYRNWSEQQRRADLEQSEQSYRAVFNSDVFIIMIHDGNRVILANRATAKFLGYDDPADLVGKTFADYIHPDDLKMVAQRASDRLAGIGSPPPVYQLRIITRTGEVRWAESHSQVITFGGRQATIANAIDITQRKQAEIDLQRRLELDKIIANVSTLFIHLSPEAIDEGIHQALGLLGAFTKADYAYLFQYDDHTHQSMSNTHEWCAEGMEPQIQHWQHIHRSSYSWGFELIERGDITLIPSAEQLPDTDPYKLRMAAQGIKSTIQVPLAYGDEVIGILGIDTISQEQAWTEDIARMLRIIGEIFATALQQRKTYHEVRRHTRTLEILNEVARVATSTLDLEPLLSEIARLTCESLNATSVYICDWDEAQQTTTVLAEYLSQHAADRERESDLGTTYHMQKDFGTDGSWLYNPLAYQITHHDDPTITPKEYAHMETYGCKTWMDVILLVDGKPIGFLEIWESRHRREFTVDEINLAKSIAHQVAGVIKRATLYAALQLSEQGNRAIIDALPDLVFRMDVEGRYLDIKYDVLEQLAAPPDDLLGKTVHDVLRRELADKFVAAIRQALQTNTVQIFEYELTPMAGVPHHYEARIVTAQAGEAFVFVRDITERKQAEFRQIELTVERERVRILQQFISDASHDLRTPIANLKSRIYLLRKAPDAERKERQLQVIETEIHRLERLIEDLLTMSQLDGEMLQFSMYEIDLNGLLRELVETHHASAERKEITLSLETDAALKPLVGNGTEINRVFGNLLSNALNYTSSGGKVTLRTIAREDGILVEVCDTGMGISPEDIPHIFDRFFRADRARRTDQGGTGLGLAIVKKIVELHNGTIEVDSTPDVGTTFRVWLPFHPALVNLPAT